MTVGRELELVGAPGPVNQVRGRGQLHREGIVRIDATDPLVTLRGISPVHQHLAARLRLAIEARNEHFPRRVLEGSTQPGAADGPTGDQRAR
jgi:hypothetical protein